MSNKERKRPELWSLGYIAGLRAARDAAYAAPDGGPPPDDLFPTLERLWLEARAKHMEEFPR